MPASTIVQNPLPQTIQVTTGKTLVRIEGLVTRAKGFLGKVTPENLERADALLKEITALDKQIESNRVQVKAPVLELERAIDAASKKARGPLGAVRQPLMGEVSACVKGIEAKRRAAEEAARRETARLEQERQEAERKRQEAIRAQEQREAAILANARAEQERKEQEKARQEAIEANAQAEEDEQVVVPEPVPEPELVEVPEVVDVPAPVREAAPVVVEMPPERVKTSVSRSRRKELVIEDASLIPYRAVEGGEPLMKPDNAAIKRALMAGLTVEGCRLETQERLASR